MGDSKKQLNIAKNNIIKSVGEIVTHSSIYATAAWGNKEQPDFLNQVLIIETKLSPNNVLDKILSIEEYMGRKRTFRNAPRIIDIDILFFNNEILKTENLTIPHKEIANRRFVLAPLKEIAPLFVHPMSKKTINSLLAECKDELNVQKI